VSPIANPALIPPGGLAPAPSSPAPGGAARPARTGSPAGRPSAPAPAGPSFAEVLRKTGSPESLSFSRHALQRVQRRNIDLGPATLARLNEGVARAAGKGSRDSVVLVDGTAFVVSVANRTVLTAVGSEHMREHVFTNVDSAVIA
jgi:flagellar operon protein